MYTPPHSVRRHGSLWHLDGLKHCVLYSPQPHNKCVERFMIVYSRNLLLPVDSVYHSIVSHESQRTASLTSGANGGA